MTKLINRVIIINHRRTSMRLCLEEWNALDAICRYEKVNRNKIIEVLEELHDCGLGLTYLTRLFMLMYYQDAAGEVLSRQQPQLISRVDKVLFKIRKLPRGIPKNNDKGHKSPTAKAPNKKMMTF